MDSLEVKDQAPIVNEEPLTEAQVEEAPVVEKNEESAEVIAADTAPVEEEAESARVVYESKADVINRVKEIAHGEEVPQKAEIDYLKTAFYKLHLAEREAQYKEFIAGGGDPEKYEVTPSEDEEVFKAEMGLIREKRAIAFQEAEEDELDSDEDEEEDDEDDEEDEEA